MVTSERTATSGLSPASRDRLATIGVPILIAVVTFAVYRWSYQGEGKNFDYFVRMSDALRHGRTDFVDHPPWLNELIPYEGKWYCVFPPMPAIVLMPFVAIFGTDLSQPMMSMLIGSASAAIAYLVLIRLFRPAVALTSTILFALGTNIWFHTEVGSGWYFAQVCGVFFLWLMLLEAVTRKRPLVVALAVSAAILCRFPTVGAIAFALVFLWPELVERVGPTLRDVRPRLRPMTLFALGLLPAVLITAWYNTARFGDPTEFGYAMIPNVLDEPWYSHGISSVHYVPGHLKELFFALPATQDNFPYLVPKISEMAIWVTTPAVVLILLAPWRNRLTLAAGAAILVTLPLHLTHGSSGFSQFGNRFSLDFVPFLVILMALGMRDRVRWWAVGLVSLSVVANLWGVVMISRQGHSVF